MDRRARLFLIGAESQDESRLREVVENDRSVHPRGDDTADGQALRVQVRLFRQYPYSLFSETQGVEGAGAL